MRLLAASPLLLGLVSSCSFLESSVAVPGPALVATLDLGESQRAPSTLGLYDQDGAPLDPNGPAEFETPIEGRFGAGFGLELPLPLHGPGLSTAARVGVLYKRYRPGDIEGLSFETLDHIEWYGSLRVRSANVGGPWGELRFAVVPETVVDSTFAPGGPLERRLRLEGDSYGKLGLGVGWEWLVYPEFGEDVRLEIGALYEVPVGESRASSTLELVPGSPVTTRTSIEPIGWTFFSGLRWGF